MLYPTVHGFLFAFFLHCFCTSYLVFSPRPGRTVHVRVPNLPLEQNECPLGRDCRRGDAGDELGMLLYRAACSNIAVCFRLQTTSRQQSFRQRSEVHPVGR